MKTIRKVEIIPVYCEFIPTEMKQGVIYISEKYDIANHLCLCGCGIQAPTPIDLEDGWKIIKKDNKVSLTPSILNPICPNKSHYIITNNIANFV